MAKLLPGIYTSCSKSWRRQTESKASSYQSPKHGIWEDKVFQSDRWPERQLVRELSRGGTDCWGNRNAQDDPLMIARAFCQRESARNPQFAALWSAATPAQANELVGIIADRIKATL